MTLKKGTAFGAASAQQISEQTPKSFGRQLTKEFAALGDADVSGFLGNDDDDRVTILAHPDGRAVTAAQLAFQFAAFGQGKLNARKGNASLADNHPEIMERRIGPKDRVEQIAVRKIGVDAGRCPIRRFRPARLHVRWP